MQVRRRAVLGAAMLAAPALARAQSTGAWPDRPMRFVIGGSAGGVSDILVRILENRLRERLGQPLVLEPRPGAGGMVGAEVVARSPGDGYSFYINHIASHGIGPTLYKRLAFDPLKDLPGVARLASMPNVLIVKGDSPHRTVQELVAFIRANPEKAVFSSAGTGTSSHLSGVLFGLRTGVETTHVPYRGTAPSMAAMLNGEVLFAIDNAPASRQQVLAGMLRALAVSTAERASTMPELPSLQEQGVADFDVASWYGIVAPAATPRPIVERMGAELVAALNDPGLAQRYRDFGAEPKPLGPDAYDAFMRGEVAKWAPVVRASGASID
jgi:tripartite-type tricarboxylate transporter receptor subunit TctC